MKHHWNGWVAIVLQELRVRWTIFLAPAALGILAYLSPLAMDGFSASSAPEIRDATTITFSLLVATVGALLLGGQMVVHPLAEQRLAFYLARPISGWTFWWGRITAALIILAVGWALVWLPTLLAGGSPWRVADDSTSFTGAFKIPSTVPWSIPEPFSVIPVWTPAIPGLAVASIVGIGVWWALSSLLFLLAGHWVYMVLRLRTRWALVDLVLLAAAAWGSLYLLGDLYQRMAFREQSWTLLALVGFILAAILWAGGRQVVRGGTDAVRSHGVFSATFWPCMFVALAAMFAVHVWMDSRGPEDLETLENLHVSPDGEWLVVSGKPWRRGSYEAVFLVHPESGESFNLGPRFAAPGPPIFSSQSTAAVWVHCPIDALDCQLHWKELQGERRQTMVPVAREYMQLYSNYRGRTLAISDDGSRVVVTYQARLEVYDFPSGKLRIAQRLNWDSMAYPFFESLDQVWAYHQITGAGDAYVDLWRLDLTDDSWTYEDSLSGLLLGLHDEADVLMLTQGWDRFVLWDRLGRQELGRHEGRRLIRSVRLLSSGQVVTVEQGSGESFVLGVYDTDGQQILSEALEEGVYPLLGGEIEAGRLLIGRRQGRPSFDTGGFRRSSELDPGRPGLWLPGFGAADDWQTQVLDASQGWVGEPWPGVLPSWQRGQTLEQGRWLLSSRGVERLEDVAGPRFSNPLALAD